MTDVKELLMKLKALAEHGVGGEKVTADQMLQKMLIKHGMTIEDLNDDKLCVFTFDVAPEGPEFRLLNQIIAKVNDKRRCGRFPKSKNLPKDKSGRFGIECTQGEYALIDQMYAVYRRLYEKEHDVFYVAFLRSNSLLVDASKEEEQATYSDEELAAYRRSMLMSTLITKARVAVALPDGQRSQEQSHE